MPPRKVSVYQQFVSAGWENAIKQKNVPKSGSLGSSHQYHQSSKLDLWDHDVSKMILRNDGGNPMTIERPSRERPDYLAVFVATSRSKDRWKRPGGRSKWCLFQNPLKTNMTMGKNKHLKVYLLLNMVIFHCHFHYAISLGSWFQL